MRHLEVPLLFILFILTSTGFSQFIYTDSISKKELLILPVNYKAPANAIDLGKVKSPQTAFSTRFNLQMKRMADKAFEKKANVVIVTEFYNAPDVKIEDCRIKGKAFKVNNFDSLKRMVLEEKYLADSEYCEVVIFRPDYGHRLFEDFKYTLEIDTFKLSIFRNCIYTLKLRRNAVYEIEIPGHKISSQIQTIDRKCYIRCTLINPPAPAGAIVVASWGFKPKVEVIDRENIGELEFSSMIQKKE